MRLQSPPSDEILWTLWSYPMSWSFSSWPAWCLISFMSALIYSWERLKQMEFCLFHFFGDDSFLELFSFCFHISFFIVFKVLFDLFDFFSLNLFWSLFLGFRFWFWLFSRWRWCWWCYFRLSLRWFLSCVGLRLFRRLRFSFRRWNRWFWLFISFGWRYLFCIIFPTVFKWAHCQLTRLWILDSTHSLCCSCGRCGRRSMPMIRIVIMLWGIFL